MIWAAWGVGVVLVLVLARAFAGAARSAERPTFVLESTILPKKWVLVTDALNRWRQEGKITVEEHERLMACVHADAAVERGG